MTISERIFALLADVQREQKELAKYIGAPPSTVTSWKRKGSNPAAEYIPAIAEFLNVSTDFLLTGENKEYRLAPEDEEVLELWGALSKADKAAVKYEMYLRAGQVRPLTEPARESDTDVTGKVG